MKIEDFDSITDALEYLVSNHDSVTRREILLMFVQKEIQEDNYILDLPVHILTALNKTDAEYFTYDYGMGICQTPEPIESDDLINELLEDLSE